MMSTNVDIELNYIPSCFYNTEGDIRFDPPIYLQRYCNVASILNKYEKHIQKVIDFGCAEMKFFYTIKHQVPCVQTLVEVDVEEDVLTSGKYRIEPLLVDFMNRRPVPLTVEVYQGSVAVPSACLVGTDAVVAIELIEHLFPEVLDALPDNVFGFIKPKFAIFTTPNVEINGIFPALKGFRHDDHKFEWTRKEFEDWAHEICDRFPSYTVTFYGIGPGPPGTEAQGCVSQLALFIRSDITNLTNVPDLSVLTSISDLTLTSTPPENYKLIAKINYPHDERTKEQRILDEAKFQIRKIEKTYTEDDGNILIPLEEILTKVRPLTDDLEMLRNLLTESGFKIVENNIKIDPMDDCSTSSEEQIDDDDVDCMTPNNSENNQNVNNVSDSFEVEENWD